MAGSVDGIVPSQVTCQNQRTRQKIVVKDSSAAWDCTAHGLEVQSGDKVKVTIQGQVP